MPQTQARITVLITHTDDIDSHTAFRHVQTRLDGWEYGVKIELVLKEEPDEEALSLRQAWDQAAGRVSAFKEVRELLNKRAGELYVNEKGDQAKVVRDLVKHIKRSRESRGT